MLRKKILVTGGAGYIGSHIVVELAKAEFNPVIVDNLSNSKYDTLERLALLIGFQPVIYEIDLCDLAAVQRLADNESDVVAIIHCAAFKSIEESIRKPLMYYRNNICSLVNLLEIFKDRKISFVFSSSCSVYGQADQLPVIEETPIRLALSPYGHTKQICEGILTNMTYINPQANVISLRYFNPVGAHDSGLIGELPMGPLLNLVPVITQTAIGKRSVLTVFGTDYDTLDGSAIRDYVHVVDIAKAHVCALVKMLDSSLATKYDVYNLGAGRGYSVLEVINAFEKYTGIKVNFELGARRDGDVDQVWTDITKAQNQLGWHPTLDLQQILTSAWKWEVYLRDRSV
jgi:UDP-glucose 4-epimerase